MLTHIWRKRHRPKVTGTWTDWDVLQKRQAKGEAILAVGLHMPPVCTCLQGRLGLAGGRNNSHKGVVVGTVQVRSGHMSRAQSVVCVFWDHVQAEHVCSLAPLLLD